MSKAPDINWKRRYVEAICTTAYPPVQSKRSPKGWDIPGWALIQMMKRIEEKKDL